MQLGDIIIGAFIIIAIGLAINSITSEASRIAEGNITLSPDFLYSDWTGHKYLGHGVHKMEKDNEKCYLIEEHNQKLCFDADTGEFLID